MVRQTLISSGFCCKIFSSVSDRFGTLCIEGLKRCLHGGCFTWRCTKPKRKKNKTDIGIETEFALKFLVGKQEKRDNDNDDEEKDGNENERSVTLDNFALPRQCNYCYQGRTTPEFYFYSDKAIILPSMVEKVRLARRSLYQIFLARRLLPFKLDSKEIIEIIILFTRPLIISSART